MDRQHLWEGNQQGWTPMKKVVHEVVSFMPQIPHWRPSDEAGNSDSLHGRIGAWKRGHFGQGTVTLGHIPRSKRTKGRSSSRKGLYKLRPSDKGQLWPAPSRLFLPPPLHVESSALGIANRITSPQHPCEAPGVGESEPAPLVRARRGPPHTTSQMSPQDRQNQKVFLVMLGHVRGNTVPLLISQLTKGAQLYTFWMSKIFRVTAR